MDQQHERDFDLRAAPPLLVPLSGDTAPGGGGYIGGEPADFRVEEIPAYEPSGEGDHAWLYIEKEDVAGPTLVRELSRRLDVPRGEVGMAGMKDRNAITRQWVSVPARALAAAGEQHVDGPVGERGRITLLETSRHSNKLKTGHLRGNRFVITVHDRAPEHDDALAAALQAMASRGVANTFGPQRFGRGDTVALGLDALGGRRIRDKRLLRLAVSAVQSALFNHWLRERVEAGLLDRALSGDVLKRRETGGLFVSEDPDTDTARIADGELVVTGPIPGAKPTMAKDEAAEREADLLARAGLGPRSFASLRKIAQGTRRPALVWLDSPEVRRSPRGLELHFALPSGSYATVVLGLLLGATAMERGEPDGA